MATEIERKFIVTGDFLPLVESSEEIIQGYLYRNNKSVVRIRICHGKAWLGVKSKNDSDSLARIEYEYEIPTTDAESMLNLCTGHIIEKTRYYVHYFQCLWEVDVFHGENEGLIIAEIELNHENEHFLRPPWVGEEVTHTPKYLNAYLSIIPFKDWHKGDRPNSLEIKE
ncbi:MAG: CYTH domain-containing protein [Tannerellaceae bacterium]|jgi:CYTH domain-containing protein|nr:CYTH domain-containing protein [Tannerellaceae bacterium]